MRQLLHGFRSSVPASRPWQELAQKKQTELNEQVARLKAMSKVVEHVLQCQCADLSDCGRMGRFGHENCQGMNPCSDIGSRLARFDRRLLLERTSFRFSSGPLNDTNYA